MFFYFRQTHTCCSDVRLSEDDSCNEGKALKGMLTKYSYV